MRCLVTGAAGFIGSHLVDYLLEEGHEVWGLDDLSTGDLANVNRQLFENESGKIQFFEIDIRDFMLVSFAMKMIKPDIVFHQAANCRTMVSVDDPKYNNDVNITGTLNVLLAARDAGVKKVVQASSCIVYAMNTPYAVSKLTAEKYGEVFSKIYDLPVVSLRYSNVYGSLRQSEKGSHINAIASLRKSKRENGRIWISGDGEQTRDWSHVIDVARANLMAAESDAVGVYDICTGVQTSMNWIAKHFNCPIDYVPERTGDAKHLSVDQDPKPALNDFDYRATIPFDEKTLEVYLD